MHALFAMTREVQAKEEAARAQLARELVQDAGLRRQALQEQSQAEAEAPLVDFDEAEWAEDMRRSPMRMSSKRRREEAVDSPQRAAKSKQSAKPLRQPRP